MSTNKNSIRKPNEGMVRSPVSVKKTTSKQKWKWILLRSAIYLVVAAAAFAGGGYGYVQLNILNAIRHVHVDTVDTSPTVTDAAGNIIEVPRNTDFEGVDVDDMIAQGDTTSSWSNGGHVPVYVHEDYPIKKVAQYDPNVTNILVFGVDARSTSEFKCRADALMVVSFDKNTDSIKIISLMRDSAVKMEGRSTPDKLTHAYFYGGVGLLINTINDNFGLDIQKFVMLDFGSAAKVIDLVGGVPIEVSPKEITYANTNITEQNNLLHTATPMLSYSGLQMLSGAQATGWARIRHLDSDFMRASRQRMVAQSLMEKVSGIDTWTQLSILDECAGMFETNMTQGELFDTGMLALQLVGNIQQFRVPEDGLFRVQENPWMEIVNWEQQVPRLREYIWGVS